MGSSAAATCTSAWVSTPPVIERVSTMDNAIPFLRLKGWHAPAGRRTREPPPLVQAGQIRPAPPVGARKNLGPGRQIDSQDNPRRRQPIRRSGRDPGPDRTPIPGQIPGGGAGALPTSSLPTLSLSAVAPADCAPSAEHPVQLTTSVRCASSWRERSFAWRFASALSDGQSQASVGDEAGQGDPLVDVVAGNG
jgi:hypothetical protein